MTKDVLVSVKGTQLMGEEDDTIEIITTGTYFEKNEKDYLLYDEVIGETGSVTHNTVKISPDRIEVMKRGLVECRMLFTCGKKQMANYQTPMGLIILGVTTQELNVKKDENTIHIHIEYSLEMNGEFVSNCRLDIRAGSQGAQILKLNDTEERM